MAPQASDMVILDKAGISFGFLEKKLV